MNKILTKQDVLELFAKSDKRFDERLEKSRKEFDKSLEESMKKFDIKLG